MPTFSDLSGLPLYIIMTYYLNEKFLRKEKVLRKKGGQVKLDKKGNEIPNGRYDPNAAQGLHLAWKLTCKDMRDTLRVATETPLIMACTSIEMLDWIRDVWNYAKILKLNVKLLGMILAGANRKLKRIVAKNALGPADERFAWIPDDPILGRRAAKIGETSVLEWMVDKLGCSLDFKELCGLACKKDQVDTLQWLVSKALKDYDWGDDESRECFFETIKHGDVRAVLAVHRSTGGFQHVLEEEEDSYNLYNKISTDANPSAKRAKRDLDLAQQLVDDPYVAENYCYGKYEKEPTYDPAYQYACPLAAAVGKLQTLKLLKNLGYELNKNVMAAAIASGHMDVAEWAARNPNACCEVKDMLDEEVPGWSLNELRKRDPESEQHLDMCAFKHLMEYTPERAAAEAEAAAAKAAEAEARAKARAKAWDDCLKENMAQAMQFVAMNPICERCGNVDALGCDLCRRT